jgi:hypothetical protein
VKNLKLFLIIALAMGSVTMFSCSKSSNNSTASTSADSVLYSKWVTVVLTFNSTDSAYEMNIAAPALTQKVIDQGAILTYVEFQGVVNLPSDFGIFPSFTVGNINLFANYAIASTDNLTFRYVIIPGKTATTNASGTLQTYTADQLKGMSYATITKLFKLSDQGSGVQFISPSR